MQFLVDGFKSLIGNLGDPARDKSAGLQYVDTSIDDAQLIAAYGSNWIARKIVTLPAQDALRKWRTWSGDSKQLIEAEEKRLKLELKLNEALVKSRLFGGAAIYIGTDQESSEPLLPDSIKSITYLTVLTRRELQAGELEQDPFSEYYGKPKDYMLSGVQSNVTIHPSRLIIFTGDEHADTWNVSGVNHGWGQSVIKSTHDAIKNAGGTFANVASLVYEANIDVIGIPDLMSSIGSAEYEKNLLKRFGLASANKGINGSLILDANEEYNRRSASFAQLPDLMDKFALHCAAAADIPATRFLGQSPSGMNSTGESDLENYHDNLQSMQKLKIGPALELFDKCLIQSATRQQSDCSYTWNPLKQMSDKDIAEIGKVTAESIQVLSELDAFTGEEIRELAIHRLAEVAAFPNIKSIVGNTAALSNLDD